MATPGALPLPAPPIPENPLSHQPLLPGLPINPLRSKLLQPRQKARSARPHTQLPTTKMIFPSLSSTRKLRSNLRATQTPPLTSMLRTPKGRTPFLKCKPSSFIFQKPSTLPYIPTYQPFNSLGSTKSNLRPNGQLTRTFPNSKAPAVPGRNEILSEQELHLRRLALTAWFHAGFSAMELMEVW